MDKQRVAQAYERYADTAVRAAWHYTGDMHSAQDCAEEAFLRLLSQEDMPDEKVLPWLIRVTVNTAKNLLKSSHRKCTDPFDEQMADGQTDSLVLARRAAARAMLCLPEKYCIPLMLHIGEGRTIADTAKIIGKGVNTTGSLIRRGKKLLQKAYEKEEL